MMRILNPTYTLTVVITDARPDNQGQLVVAQAQGIGFQPAPPSLHKFHDRLGKSGCDEVLAAVRSAVKNIDAQCEVTLERFEMR